MQAGTVPLCVPTVAPGPQAERPPAAGPPPQCSQSPGPPRPKLTARTPRHWGQMQQCGTTKTIVVRLSFVGLSKMTRKSGDQHGGAEVIRVVIGVVPCGTAWLIHAQQNVWGSPGPKASRGPPHKTKRAASHLTRCTLFFMHHRSASSMVSRL